MPITVLLLAAELIGASHFDRLQSRPQATVRGRIVDARTSAPVADARVQLVELARSSQTGPDGRFEFAQVAAGKHTLSVSTIGYIFVRRAIEVGAGGQMELTIPLTEGAGAYQETVDVAADRARPPSIGVSSQNDLGSAGLQDLRGVAADDPMRALQALPGVATGDDFQAEFSVRGSAFRQIGVVMDGTATSLLLHAVRGQEDTGSVAMVNTDVLSGASITAGAHARRDGDWLGATVEFEVREGSRDRVAFRAAVSGTSTSAVLEGPIGSARRGSWLMSIRKSYLDWLIRKLEPGIDSTIGFFDGQAKVVFDVTSRQQLQVLVIGGDATYEEVQASLANGLLRAKSGTTLASTAWRYVSPRWIVSQRASFVGSDYRNHGIVGQELARGYSQSVGWRADATSLLSGGWTVEFGAKAARARMNQILRDFVATGPSRVRLRRERGVTAQTTFRSAWLHAARRTDAGGIAAGLRVSTSSIADRTAVSPWAMAERRFGSTTVRAGAGLSAQFPELGTVMVDEINIPERAFSADLGFEHQLSPAIRLQAGAFRRREQDVLRAADEDRLDPITRDRIVEAPFPIVASSLEGTSRGVDVTLIRRASSGLTGWIGYTWAHTRYRDTQTGETFDADFDQRHTFNVFAQQRLSYRMTVSAKFRAGSNFPIAGYFEPAPAGLRLGAHRNQVRLPVYARLDLRATRTFTFDRRRLTLFVEAMNALGRRNLGQADGSIRSNLDAVGFAEKLIPFVPSAGILIEF